jgi:hypothetical protein
LDAASIQLGYLTILQDAQGYSGGYLLTNAWGRPLEFRLTSAVQPTKVQQLLYGPTLRPYVCADLLGKALLEKSSAPPMLLITDCDASLELRLQSTMPVVWLGPLDHPHVRALDQAGAVFVKTAAHALCCHARFPEDAAAAKTILHAAHIVDLAEPFSRIREALAESRKSRDTSKAA